MSLFLTRRRFLAVTAAATAVPAAASPVVARWSGRALGARASMQIVGLDAAEAAPLFAIVESELTRLERIFSLHDPASEISRLNRDGVLAHPSPELLEVLATCDMLNGGSGGAFDPTIQPVWQAVASGGSAGDATGPVGWDKLRFGTGAVRFGRTGMALTLNGIAQGAITDRVMTVLRARGLHDIAVDMGEVRVVGEGPAGGGWRAGVSSPEGRIVARVTLRDEALATSAPMGTRIGPNRDLPHILNPSGQAPSHRLVSVAAPTAMLADGLSTALCLLDPAVIPGTVAQVPGARIVWAA